MEKIVTKIICLILLCTGIIVFSVGCTFFSPLVGQWQAIGTNDTIEFTRTGDVIIKSSGFTITGKYEPIGSDVVKLKLEGLSGAWISLFGGDTWQYSISGNILTVTAAGQISKFKRI